MNRRILVVLTLVAFVFSMTSAFAAIDKVPGIPKGAPFVYTMNLTAEHKASMKKFVDMVVKNPEFDKMTAKFAQETGTEFPKGIFEKMNTVTNLSIGALPNSKDPKDAPNMAVVVTFDNDKSPVEVLAKIKEKFAQIYKKQNNDELVFTDGEEEGVKVTALSSKDKTKDQFKNEEFRFLVSGNVLAMAVQKTGENAVKSVIAAIKNDKETVVSSDKFKAAVEKVGKNASSVFFFDGELMKKLDQKGGPAADVLNYFALGGEVTGDLSKITTNAIVSLNDVKDPEGAKVLSMLKKLFAGIKRDVSPATALPGDVVIFLDLKFNVTKDLFTMPETQMVAPMLMAAGLNLEEDVISWLDGGIIVGISDIPNPKEIMEKGGVDFYIGFRSANNEKAGKFLDKLAAFIKNTGGQIEFKDETVADIKVKTTEVKGAPVKDLVLTIGAVDKFMMVASNRKAFEKAVKASKGENLAANAEFKALAGNFDPASFIGYFMNSEKLTQIAMAIDPRGAAKGAKNDFAKLFYATGSMQNNDIVGSIVVTADLSKITPEMISEQLKLAAERAVKKDEAAPAPAGEEKKDEPKSEEKKDEAKPEEGKAEEKSGN